MYGKIDYANALEKEFLSLFKGLEQVSKSAFRLLSLLGRGLKFLLGGLAKIFFSPPKLMRRLSPGKFEVIEGAAKESHYGFHRGPPNNLL